jgi:mutator family transposase
MGMRRIPHQRAPAPKATHYFLPASFPARRPRPLPKDLHQLAGAAIRPIFCAGTLEEARRLLGETVTHLEPRVPKVARLLLEAEPDLLAFYAFPAEHWSKLRSTDESFKARVALSAGWDGVSLLGGRGRPRSQEQGRGAGSPAAQLAP